MGSYFFGFLISILVTIAPILVMSTNKGIFLSLEALIIIVGGTVGIALSSYPFYQVRRMLAAVFIIFRKEIDDGPKIASEIIALARDTRGERAQLSQTLNKIRYPFLRDGVILILDKIEEDLQGILLDRIRTKQEEDESIINMVRRLGQFPPALGLLATVLSLVGLLQGLGDNSLGMTNLGPSMALGLVGTLYGIVTANLVFAPIAENLAMRSMLDVRNRQIAMVGILLLNAKKSPLVVQESLNSLLSVSKRVDVLALNTPNKERKT